MIKRIPGFIGYYATEDGEIISTRRSNYRILSKRIHKGYYYVKIWNDGKRKEIKVHHLILFAFYGDRRLEGLECRHLNGNPLDNKIENLKWGTSKENSHDAIKHGTAVCLRKGINAPANKLNKNEINEIKEKLQAGERQINIARQFNISQRHVSGIKHGETFLSNQ